MLVIQDEQLAHDLARVAQQEDLAVEELLKSMLAQYTAQKPPQSDDFAPGTSQWVAAHLDEIAFETANPIAMDDIEEVLRTEFADYLLKRMN